MTDRTKNVIAGLLALLFILVVGATIGHSLGHWSASREMAGSCAPSTSATQAQCVDSCMAHGRMEAEQWKLRCETSGSVLCETRPNWGGHTPIYIPAKGAAPAFCWCVGESFTQSYPELLW